MTAQQAKEWTLNRFVMTNLVHQCHTELTHTGVTHIPCPSGYEATLVLSSYDRRCGIALKDGAVCWLANELDAVKLIRDLMGL